MVQQDRRWVGVQDKMAEAERWQVKVNAQLKAANMKSERDQVGGRISVSNSPGKRRNG